MRKQTHSKKGKASNPKRRVAKKNQRQIRGGARPLRTGAVVVLPIMDRGTVIEQGAIFLPGNMSETPDIVFPRVRQSAGPG